MCGRFSLFAPRAGVEERFAARFEDPYERRYNAAPGQALHVIKDAAPERITTAEWGLQPARADQRSDGGFINARAETVAEKRSFRPAVEGAAPTDREGGNADSGSEREASQSGPTAGRCLVPADGFYEWAEEEEDRRQPYRIQRPDGELFAMAGLWTKWTPERRQADLAQFDPAGGADVAGESTSGTDPDVTAIETFAIVTTEPNEVASRVHDRMPVVLAPEAEMEWLEADAPSATDLLDPYEGALELFAISEEVNDPSNDYRGVVEPVEG